MPLRTRIMVHTNVYRIHAETCVFKRFLWDYSSDDVDTKYIGCLSEKINCVLHLKVCNMIVLSTETLIKNQLETWHVGKKRQVNVGLSSKRSEWLISPQKRPGESQTTCWYLNDGQTVTANYALPSILSRIILVVCYTFRNTLAPTGAMRPCILSRHISSCKRLIRAQLGPFVQFSPRSFSRQALLCNVLKHDILFQNKILA